MKRSRTNEQIFYGGAAQDLGEQGVCHDCEMTLPFQGRKERRVQRTWPQGSIGLDGLLGAINVVGWSPQLTKHAPCTKLISSIRPCKLPPKAMLY
jgi:hypothetical protein